MLWANDISNEFFAQMFTQWVECFRCSLNQITGIALSHLYIKLFTLKAIPIQFFLQPSKSIWLIFQLVSFSQSNIDSFQQIQIVFLNQLSPSFNLTSLFEIQFLRRNSAKIKANAAHVFMYIYMGRGLSEKSDQKSR